MPDVIHDPETDWCACEPYGDSRCDYRLLADAVIDSLDVRDGDEAEVSLLITAVENVKAYVESQPCTCTPEDIADWEPCPRCRVIGRLGNEVMNR